MDIFTMRVPRAMRTDYFLQSNIIEMSMFSGTSTGMINSHMRITSVSRNIP